jgi:hypothetical protein
VLENVMPIFDAERTHVDARAANNLAYKVLFGDLCSAVVGRNQWVTMRVGVGEDVVAQCSARALYKYVQLLTGGETECKYGILAFYFGCLERERRRWWITKKIGGVGHQLRFVSMAAVIVVVGVTGAAVLALVFSGWQLARKVREVLTWPLRVFDEATDAWFDQL